ncbi:hypothetical protein MPLB_910004 [Mesorhizobium sp. ORS 3324]|nr:hypothetical protein MPLB_910004 [Mesorhizobium sp. ORS 3324]
MTMCSKAGTVRGIAAVFFLRLNGIHSSRHLSPLCVRRRTIRSSHAPASERGRRLSAGSTNGRSSSLANMSHFVHKTTQTARNRRLRRLPCGFRDWSRRAAI